MGAPSALVVEAAGVAAADKVGPAGGLGLRVDDVTSAALGAVAVGLLEFAELELVHDSLVVIDLKSGHLYYLVS